MKKYTLLFLAIFFITCHSPSQKTPEKVIQNAQLQDKNVNNVSSDLTEKLQKAFLELENDPDMQTGFQGFSLRDAQTNTIVFEKNANKNFNIASNLKLLTTATALLVLGDDFTFKTMLEYDGNINNGVLEGNIYIKGGGDPTLGSYKMNNTTNFDDLLIIWANAIKTAGIKEIKGQIIADTRLYDDNAIPQGWIWGDIGNYYGAPAYALNIADNSYQINFTPATKIDEIAQIASIFPQIPNLIFTNKMKTATAGTGDNGYIDGAPYQYTRFLHGTIPQMPQGGTFSIKGSIPDPAYLCAQKLQEILKKQNINTSKDATCTRLLMQISAQKNTVISSETKKIIHTQKSPTLKNIVSWINLYSVNLYAEGVFKAVNLQLNSQNNNQNNNQNNAENNTEKLFEFWKNKKINLETAKIEDGSGLSKDNGISPNLMTALLSQMQKETDKGNVFDSFYKSLPIAGVSGTLTSVGKGTILAGNLRAKTGSLSNAIAFSGYFKNVQGKMMCFSLVANGFKGSYGKIKPKLEKIMLIMTE